MTAVPAVLGPTAVGKSRVALEVAVAADTKLLESSRRLARLITTPPCSA